MERKKFALIGASMRGSIMYAGPMTHAYKDVADLVAIVDTNYGRAKLMSDTFSEEGNPIPFFTSFEDMMAATKPEAIVVATVDKYHAEYIIKGLEAGLEVITEKPMCIDAEQCRAILEAEKKYNNNITVTFNVRFALWCLRIKELVPELVGDVFTVNLDWMLAGPKVNGSHGASYYRRWNGYMDQSGGLLITKATHHFDMVNWFVESRPIKVNAFGKLRTYGKNGPFRAKNCRTCPHTGECDYYTPINEDMQKRFVDNEQYDGYLIDRCVYDEEIDIYDTMAVNVEYENGAVLTYTESSAAPYEGFKLVLNGSKGRMEVTFGDRGGYRDNEFVDFIKYFDLHGNIRTYSMPHLNAGGHGGADSNILDNILRGKAPRIPTQHATSIDGAYSILIGAAANVSIKEDRTVVIDELIGDPSLLKRD